MESVQSFWIPEVRKMSNVQVILVATQVDLRKDDCSDHITSEEGKQFARGLNIEHFIESSSLNNSGVREIFENVVHAAITNKKSRVKWLKSILGS